MTRDTHIHCITVALTKGVSSCQQSGSQQLRAVRFLQAKGGDTSASRLTVRGEARRFGGKRWKTSVLKWGVFVQVYCNQIHSSVPRLVVSTGRFRTFCHSPEISFKYSMEIPVAGLLEQESLHDGHARESTS